MAAPDAVVTIELRSITLGLTLKGRIESRGAGHNVYAIASIGPKDEWNLDRQLGRSAPIDGSANVVDLTAQRMAWAHTMPVQKTDILTVAVTIIDDEVDKAPVEMFTMSFDFDPASEPDGDSTKTSGEVSVACRFRAIRAFPRVDPNPVAIGDGHHNVIATPAVVRAEITSIRGLFQPTDVSPDFVPVGTPLGALSTAVDGYISEDNLGRVFISRNPKNGAWTRAMQSIDLEVKLTITGMSGKRLNKRRNAILLKWTVYVPDDATDDDRNVHRSEGALLDPTDYHNGAPLGAAGYDNEGTNEMWARYQHVWEKLGDWTMTVGDAADPIGVPRAMNVNGFNVRYLKPAETATVHVAFSPSHGFTRSSGIRMHCPNRRGDRFIIRVEPVEAGGAVCIPAQTGIITMWERIDVEYSRMKGAYELPIASVPSHFEKLFVQMDFSKEKKYLKRISRMPAKDIAAFVKKNFKKRTTAGWFCLMSFLALGEEKDARVVYTGDVRLRNAATMVGDAATDPLKFLRDIVDAQVQDEEAVDAAEKAIRARRKTWLYEFIDVPAKVPDKASVVLQWQAGDSTLTLKFDQCPVETITLEPWDTRRGVRQRLRLLGYTVSPVITSGFYSQEEQDALRDFTAANVNLAARIQNEQGAAAKTRLVQKWLHWRAITPAATNATAATDQANLDPATGIAAEASRVWISPHDVQNKFTAGDGSESHAYRHRLMFGPVYRERIESNDSKAISQNGYGAPPTVTVTIKPRDVEHLGQSPPTLVQAEDKKVVYFAGMTVIATDASVYRPSGAMAGDFHGKVLIAIVHEFTHAFGMPHKCARWDTAARRTSTCCMNYGPNWMVNAADDTLVPSSSRKVGTGMCGMHIREVRRVLLEDNAALQSRNWK